MIFIILISKLLGHFLMKFPTNLKIDLKVVQRQSTRFQKAETPNFTMRKFWVPLGYHSVPKTRQKSQNLRKSRFLQHTKMPPWYPRWYPNGTQNVEWYPNGTQDGTQVVPKLPDTFYCMINFHHFEGPKNGSEATLTIILGTIGNSWVPSMIFSENISCQLLEKKMV